MKAGRKNSGITLTEMVVVIGAVAVLTALGLPAIRAFIKSFESEATAKGAISASLASARATAAKEQRYAGVRFQQKWEEGGKEGCQYMIFIIHDQQETGLEHGFRAVKGVNPIKLPDHVGVMDLRVRTNYGANYNDAEDSEDQTIIGFDDRIDDIEELRDATTFSIVFSPSGKLVIRDVRVRNKDGEPRPDGLNDSGDDIFNSPVNIEENNTGMFVQDDYAYLGLGQEPSKKSFVIYDRNVFKNVNQDDRYKDCLKNIEPIYINPYTGTLIDR
jgi:type II secretory pathway pseudopilin PulG